MTQIVYVVASQTGGYAREDMPIAHVDGVYTNLNRAIAHSKVVHGTVTTMTIDATPAGIAEYLKEMGYKDVQ